MGSYRLLVKKSIAKDLRAIPKRDLLRILKRIDGLTDDPRGPGTERLVGQNLYRTRQGDYRILYEIQDTKREVVVIKVAHRSTAYDEP